MADDDTSVDAWVMQAANRDDTPPHHLEHDNEHEAWFWVRPLKVETVECTDPEEQERMNVPRYAATHEELPDAIVVERQTYTRSGTGTVRRSDVAVTVHAYEGESGDFILIEGESPDALKATARTEISLADVSIR